MAHTTKVLRGRTPKSSLVDFFLIQLYTPESSCLDLSTCRVIPNCLRVGRAPSAEPSLELLDGAASRNHFSLERSGRRLYIEDLASANGTFVNGNEIQRAELHANDVIRAGGTLFLITHSLPADLDWLKRRGLAGASSEFEELIRLVQGLAGTQLSLLFCGKTGTGKEMLARLAHDLSGVKGNFEGFNCAAIPPTLFETHLFGSVEGAFSGANRNAVGFFEKAAHGTLLLDELGEVDAHLQSKLLRVLQEREYFRVGETESLPADVRVMVATTKEPYDEEEGLRPDLLARVEDCILRIPPLSERKLDILPVVELELSKRGVSWRALTPDFVERLLCYSWPRNIRQLTKAINRCIKLGGSSRLSCEELDRALDDGVPVATSSPNGSPPPALKPLREGNSGRDSAPPLDELILAMEKFDGNVSALARHFGVHRRQVYRWLDRRGLR